MRKALTKKVVEAISPGPKDVIVWDTKLPGFGCKVTPGGVRSFVLKYPVPGLHLASRRMVIGIYGPMTFEEAKAKAIELKAQIHRGVDPASVKAEVVRAAREDTVERLFTAYLDQHRGSFKPRTMEYYESLARLYITPAIGKCPVASITKADLVQFHRKMQAKPITANRVIGLLSMFYRWLEDTYGFEGKNPAARFTGYRETARERFLTVEEMGRLGEALRLAETVGLPPAPIHTKEAGTKRKRNSGMFISQLVPANPVAVSVIRFLALSGWRKNEALNLTWREVNLTTGAVTLTDTKTGKSMRTLGGAALMIIAAQPQVDGSDYVFPGRDPKHPLRELQRLWYAARHAAKLPDVRLHDLRHSVASVAGGHGYSLPLIGKLLGHKTTRSTERYAHHHADASKVVADTVSAAIKDALDGNTTPIIPIRIAG